MAKDRTKIESEDVDGKKKTIYIKRPDSAINRQAQLAYNRAFRDALQSGAILRQKLDDILREQDVWNDDKQNQYDDIVKKLNDNERAIDAGGIKLSEAADLAKEMRDKRLEFRDLISERTLIDTNTAEGQADNARFNFLVQVCMVDQAGKKVFEDVDAYENSEAHPYAIEGARILAEQLYGLDANYDQTLPENKFLKQYKFVDEKLRFIDDDGKLIDEEGKFVNEDGRYVEYEDDGTIRFVDFEGNRVDEDGANEVDFAPFLDDKGKPVPVPEKAEAEVEAEDEAEAEAEAKTEEEEEGAESKPVAKKKPGRPKKETQTADKTE